MTDSPSPASAPVASDPRWKSVATRDTTADRAFVYAVRSTEAYCNSSCPSRLPNPGNVRYFATVAEAQAAGFGRAAGAGRTNCRSGDSTTPSSRPPVD